MLASLPAVPAVTETPSPYRPEAYTVQALRSVADEQHYRHLLAQVYEPLGFMSERVMPEADSQCFVVRHDGRIAGIFRLTPVVDADSPYHQWLPAQVQGNTARWLEVNNVVIATEFRATVLLGVILYHCACVAHRQGYAAVVGITRLQTLRFFADFGVVPVDHPPLHLLGRPDLRDFVIYYDTRDAESVAYLHARARRWFHQQYVMRCIQQRCRPAVSGAGARLASNVDVPSRFTSEAA